MKNNGLFAFCGIPGSGKTLNATVVALSHYKKENMPHKYLIAYLKYKLSNNNLFKYIVKLFNKYNFYKIMKSLYIVWFNKSIKSDVKINFTFAKLSMFLFKFLKYFFKFIVLIYIYVCPSWFVKILLFILLFYTKKIISWFDSLDYEYICTFSHKKINNIYSTYPILLDKKRGIYSHKVSLWDLNNLYSFLPNSIIIIDEIQLFVDSDEYKDKKVTEVLKKIGNYFQAHRHFGIKNIIVTSQGVTRIFKKCRDVCSGYLKLNKVIKIPFIPFGYISGTYYYDIDYYGKYIPKNREERRKLPFEYKKYRKICNMSRVYSSYDSRYLANLNYSQPLLNKGEYDTLRTSEDDIKEIFKTPEELISK